MYSIDSQELQLSTSNSQLSGDLSQNIDSALSLPQEILSSIPQDRNVSVAFTVYNFSALFPVRNTSLNMAVSNTVVGSQVVSVQVGGIDDGTRLDAPVVFSLRLINYSPSSVMNKIIVGRRCVFWNFTAASKSTEKLAALILVESFLLLDGNGEWSTDGCSLKAFNESANVVDCMCDHLTNFACLVVLHYT